MTGFAIRHKESDDVCPKAKGEDCSHANSFGTGFRGEKWIQHHFQVAPSLCLKVRPSAKLMIWKWLFILRQIKLTYAKKVFCTWPCFESESFGNGLLQCYRRLFGPMITTLTVPYCVLRSKKKMKSLMWYLSSRLRAKRGSGLPKEEQRIKLGKD